MLSGVAFKRTEKGVQPEFVNQFILTDVYIAAVSSPSLRIPILPSIATLVNPISTLFNIIWRIFRTLLLVFLSHLPGSDQAIKRISVANTGLLFHDGRALATCESGPPMRVSLPGLETVGWYNGNKAEGEADGETGAGFGDKGLLSFMREWTTAHPRVDPISGELIAFHSAFAPPYVHYSIIPASHPSVISTTPFQPGRLLNAAVPGIASSKMMHDFGVSFTYTIILDLPLSLDPLNLARNKPVVSYNPNGRSRFGVFPRYQPQQVQWFETDPCCIFHTANSWDEINLNKLTGQMETTAVNMLSCRLTSASLVFSAGDIAIPETESTPLLQEEEQCRLYYHQFHLGSNQISHEFALSAVPFEFPSLRDDRSMSAAKYVYGCSISHGTFGAALGRAVKIDCLVKIDAERLIARGRNDKSIPRVRGCVDSRTMGEILISTDPNDPISVFKLPHGYYAQESRFVPRENSVSEDDGFILTYVFDETQLDELGESPSDARSELWIIDAKDMKTVIGKISLPQRVPYGLHGNWFSEEQVLNQRPIERIRQLPKTKEKKSAWMAMRRMIERVLG